MKQKLFIAISYDDNQQLRYLQQVIAEQIQPLLLDYNGIIRLQKHLHFTVYFLGYKPTSDIPLIIKTCHQVINIHQQVYKTCSLAHYSSKISFDIIGNHEVIALMLEPSTALSNLYDLFVKEFEQNKTAQNIRSFLPHITLARIKKIHRKDFASLKIAISMLFDAIAKKFPNSMDMSANEIILFSSEQGEYTELAKFIV